MLCQIAKFGLNEKVTEVTTTSISYNGCGFNDVITDQVVVPHVPVPFRTCAAVAVPPTTLSSPAPPISQRPAQGPTGVPAPATMAIANDKVRLLSRNILPLVSIPINVVILERDLSHNPNPDFSNSLINTLRFGTDVGHTGPEKNRVSRNLISAVQHPEVVSSNLTNEISLGRVAGPFPFPPLRHFSAIRWAGSLKNIPQIGPPFIIYLIRRGAVLMIIYLRTLMHFNMLG